MAKPGNENRHLGVRIEFYLPESEKDAMDTEIKLYNFQNRTEFLRSSIKSFSDYLKAKRAGKKNV